MNVKTDIVLPVVKVLYVMLLILLSFELVALIFALLFNLSTSGRKAVSLTDFNQLGMLVFVTVILFTSIYFVRKALKK